MATARLTLVAPASTAAARSARFPLDEPLDDLGARAAAEYRLERGHDAAVCGPVRRCRETAESLGLVAPDEPSLAPWDVGRWAGCAPEALAPEDLAAWRADPEWAGHGGESLRSLIERAAAWLAGLDARRTIAVADPALIRAVVASALPGGWELFWAVDVAPLGQVDLAGARGRWTLTGLR